MEDGGAGAAGGIGAPVSADGFEDCVEGAMGELFDIPPAGG